MAKQQQPVDPAVQAQMQAAAVFQKGSQLERERRWAEALSHYEDALRQHPERNELQQRVTIARAHYEVCRRYNDPSFATAISTLSERDELPSEEFLKGSLAFPRCSFFPRVDGYPG